MRLLHTSDWHLGRPFHGASLRREQEHAVGEIADLVADHRVQVVIVAGDIYDRAIPPSDAIALFDDALVRIREAGAAVVAISGNHDSAVRVGFGDRLLAAAGVTIRGDLARGAEPVLFPGDDGGPPVAVYPVPYLDPLAVAHLARSTEQPPGTGRAPDRCDDDRLDEHPVDRDEGRVGAPGDPARPRRLSHDRAMAWALDRVRADLAQRAARSVVVAHTFVNGAAPSDSERELTVGNVDLVGLETFAGFHYAALGHLHRAQSWADERIAYSGSPLPYSFSEEHHPKSVRLVELAPDGSVAVQVEPLRAGRRLRTIEGELEVLLADPDLRAAEVAFVRVILTDRHLPLQAMSRVQRRFPFAVELRHQPAATVDARLPGPPADLDARRADPFSLSLRFLDAQRGFPAESAEREVLTDAFADARRSEAS